MFRYVSDFRSHPEVLHKLMNGNFLLYFCVSGRGDHSHAYTHSVLVGHHVYLNLHTLKVRRWLIRVGVNQLKQLLR